MSEEEINWKPAVIRLLVLVATAAAFAPLFALELPSRVVFTIVFTALIMIGTAAIIRRDKREGGTL